MSPHELVASSGTVLALTGHVLHGSTCSKDAMALEPLWARCHAGPMPCALEMKTAQTHAAVAALAKRLLQLLDGRTGAAAAPAGDARISAAAAGAAGAMGAGAPTPPPMRRVQTAPETRASGIGAAATVTTRAFTCCSPDRGKGRRNGRHASHITRSVICATAAGGREREATCAGEVGD